MAQPAIQQTFDLAVQHHLAGRLRDAQTLYRQILAAQPNHVDAMLNLAIIVQQTGGSDAAVELIRRAIALRPDDATAHNNLASILCEMGRYDEAIAAAGRAIQLNPNHAASHYNLANALSAKGDFDAAIASFRRAIQLKADYSEAYNNLGTALVRAGRIDEAIASYQQSLRIKPDHSPTHNNLANAFVGKGQFDKAIAEYRRAVELSPSAAGADSNLVYMQNFRPGATPADLLAESLRWAKAHAEPLRSMRRPHDNDRDPDRRLRIGYVSPDFHGRHCQSLFTAPLFRSHDPQKFDVFCYANVTNPDAVTEILRAAVGTWRSTVGQSDAQVADMIRADRIDILVDLTMHMAHGRPLLFARKPAPVQVAWLAYPGTTGIDAIDYRLTDPYLDPPGTNDQFYSERSIRLPSTFWCFDPMSDERVGEMPAARNGFVTFGCLSNFCKINEQVLAFWSRVLKAVPQSRFILLSPIGDHRQWALERLAVESGRVQFVNRQPRPQYLRMYHQIDIILDTIPYNGHTTTLDSLWMGVPVVSLLGNTVVGRAGLSILTNVGLSELVAENDDEFVRCAVDLAGDLPRLANIRQILRPRMLKSPLMDSKTFAADIENAYRRMWQAWCASAPRRG